MRKGLSYHALTIGLRLLIIFAMCAGVARAQRAPRTISTGDLYCSGTVSDQPPATDTYLISGEDSSYKTTFMPGDLVYINEGADHGVKIGDQFEVIRPVRDASEVKWFRYQRQLDSAMGTTYADIGRLRVVSVQQKTSTAEMGLTCDPMQRGDIVRPFQPRPSPTLHDVKLDIFAPPSGKKIAMVVTSKDFSVMAGAGRIVYVNLGSSQGVQVGNYFRIFRYQGTRIYNAYQMRDTAYKMYGFGSTPVAYEWDSLPRQIMGEGIVLRTGPNSSTVLLTDSREEIYLGDYAELE
jgi:hypothetical protein